ncbi:uncharacterized protein [Argopecten irradians]|uniref:uncharacterized protein n=1 Tax=Argopecten irradians TaxID=31199 RepID=UPI00371BA1E9
METTRSLAILSLLFLVPLVLGAEDQVEPEAPSDMETCKMVLNQTLTKDERPLRCWNCQNRAIDHTLNEECKCPEGTICDARQAADDKDVYEYFCTTPPVESERRSGLYLNGEPNES